ncbi:unnamed protein product (macronuclear) [Paramecium tetraurelia]|uniref:Uncharacterized protein n=1 Tax=Paramecium tetraurelia TaxID=5888 RepID=A0BXJ2_PARTE|nr:uncharacterized protein GSPATT00033112001 [Paramecium tetraurelia]CAK63259.1 unnamed protein product [Paramecium tetraurelia]|eukprot:XP_001430657.1 hypothetical protein (macronuclear) [Paramecium tetraurelia strain d4-2]
MSNFLFISLKSCTNREKSLKINKLSTKSKVQLQAYGKDPLIDSEEQRQQLMQHEKQLGERKYEFHEDCHTFFVRRQGESQQIGCYSNSLPKKLDYKKHRLQKMLSLSNTNLHNVFHYKVFQVIFDKLEKILT